MSLLSIFLASILGSAHCVGMCGGIVLLYSDHEEKKTYTTHLGYNVGRLSSYVFLGGIAGALGHSLNLTASITGISHIAGLIFGVLLVLWGGLILIRNRGIEPVVPGATWVREFYRKVASSDSRTPLELRAYLLGALSTLLPCGWLYMFAAVAAASGDVLWGMLIMFVFWLGTLPYLISVGVASQLLLGKLRRHIPRITAILIIIAGSFSVLQHLHASDSVQILQDQPSGGTDLSNESADCH